MARRAGCCFQLMHEGGDAADGVMDVEQKMIVSCFGTGLVYAYEVI